MSGDFILESVAGPELARAEKPSAFRRSFVIRHAGRSYTLRATSMWQFTLFDDPEKSALSRQMDSSRGERQWICRMPCRFL